MPRECSPLQAPRKNTDTNAIPRADGSPHLTVSGIALASNAGHAQSAGRCGREELTCRPKQSKTRSALESWAHTSTRIRAFQ